MMGDGPRVVVDLPALIAKPEDWWKGQARLRKISTDDLKKSSLITSKWLTIIFDIKWLIWPVYLEQNKIFNLAAFESLTFLRAWFLFLVILELPDAKVAGFSRGEAVWRVLKWLVVEPFDPLGLVASRFRGKS